MVLQVVRTHCAFTCLCTLVAGLTDKLDEQKAGGGGKEAGNTSLASSYCRNCPFKILRLQRQFLPAGSRPILWLIHSSRQGLGFLALSQIQLIFILINDSALNQGQQRRRGKTREQLRAQTSLLAILPWAPCPLSYGLRRGRWDAVRT